MGYLDKLVWERGGFGDGEAGWDMASLVETEDGGINKGGKF